MKSFIVTVLVLAGVNAFAGTSRGYLAELRRGNVAYLGLTDSNVDIQLPESDFTATQRESMNRCMDSRETKAIQVTMENTKVEVPTDIPGRTTFVTVYKVTGVRCVSAPGFINHWREFFNRR